MSDKQQTPSNSNTRTILTLIVIAIVAGIGWLMWQSNKNTDTTTDNTKKTQSADKTPAKTDEYKDWKSYTWESQGVSFKYPGTWFVQENTGQGRLYVKNTNVDLLKEETPDNFQQLWLSADTDETALARENNIKKGLSDFRQVSGAVTASTLKVGSLTINVYEYETVGGPTLEAYWTNKAGHRLLATSSTEVGQQNQKDMVANLKKLLASVTLK